MSRLYCIVDLHAITVKSSSSLPPLQQRSFQCAAFLIACGLDSSRCTLFVQSHVPQHTSLCWLLQCCTPLSWLHRMTQFKSKSDSSSQESAPANTALLTYPVLQAADILLYDFAPRYCSCVLILNVAGMTQPWSLLAMISCSTLNYVEILPALSILALSPHKLVRILFGFHPQCCLEAAAACIESCHWKIHVQR